MWFDVVKVNSLLVQGSNPGDPDYFTIEGMRSQEFSVGIFVFLVICIIVFTGIVFAFARSEKGKELKTGEKILLVWIMLGVVGGIALGAVQLLQGRLF